MGLEGLSLPIFPEGPLQGSVIVTVFIGIVLMTFFTESFGWVYSGLVVPGYLAPILIVAPFSAAVILLEAVITYWMVEFLSERLSRPTLWAPMFGRDKFICIIFVSILVRLGVELYLLPELGLWIQRWDPAFDYRNKFTGIGLIVVPLLANMIWKPGLLRGLGHASTSILLTWAITSLVLLPYTNFSVARFHFLYEAVALDFAASPKTYIILIAGVLLAAQLNLYLGWDFNGVMVPTLLAIAWLTPLRLATTLGEGVLILMLSKLVVRIPPFSRMTIEGPRLICLLYTLGFLEKMAVGHLCARLWPEFQYEDLFGAGYMLSTLLAVKMRQKQIFLRLTLPVAQVSLGSLAIGSVLGWACLSWLNPTAWFRAEAAPLKETHSIRRIPQAPYDVVVQDITRLLRPGGNQKVARMMPAEAQTYQELIRLLAEASGARQPAAGLDQAVLRAAQLDLELCVLEEPGSADRYVYLREPPGAAQPRGWGLVLFRLGRSEPLLLEAPRPVDEPRTAESALVLMQLLKANALLIPGAHYRTNPDGTSDAMRWGRLPFRQAHQQLHSLHVLEVRSLLESRSSQLWVETVLPDSIVVKDLVRWLNGLDLAMPPTPPPVYNDPLRVPLRPSYCTLTLAPLAARSLLAARFQPSSAAPGTQPEPLAERGGHIVRAVREQIEALQASQRLDPEIPETSRLLFIEQQIVAPLIDIALGQAAEGARPAADSRLTLGPVAHAAEQIGYRLELVRHLDGACFAVLFEDPARVRGWGVYALRLGPARALHLLVPYPLSEQNTYGAALDLFAALHARALSIPAVGPQHLMAEALDARMRFESTTLYQLFHQVLQRRTWTRDLVVSLEVRGSRAWPAQLRTDGILREGNQFGGGAGISEKVRALVEDLNALALPVALHTGEEGLLGFGLGSNPQLKYSVNHGAGPYAALWLSQEARLRFGEVLLSPQREAAFAACGLPCREVALAGWLEESAQRAGAVLPATEIWGLFGPLVREARAYVGDRNVVRIAHLARMLRASGLRYELLKDDQRNLPLLALEGRFFPDQRVRILVNLSPVFNQAVQADGLSPRQAAQQMLDQRPAVLVFGAPLPPAEVLP